MLIRNSKLSLKELGLEKSKLRNGVVVNISLFLILQLYGLLYSYFTLGKFVISEGFTEWTIIVGSYLQYIFGVALFEEVAFRGFLIPQVFIRLKSNGSFRMLVTLIISQFLFSIVHIPIRLVSGVNFLELVMSLVSVFVIGLIFSFIYLLTENLFIAMGIHAIWDLTMNNAISIFTSKYAIIVILIFSFMLLYISVTRNRSKTVSI